MINKLNNETTDEFMAELRNRVLGSPI